MRRIAILGLGIVVAVGLILGIWAQLSISAKWSRLQERVRELEAETAPGPVNGWEPYEAAVSRLRDSSFRASSDEPLPQGEELLKLKTTIGELAPAFESLRAGARSEKTCPANIDLGMDAHGIGRAAILQARLWRLDGRLKEAADLALSTATFARDIADEGSGGGIYIGLEILDDAWEEVRLLIAEKGLSEADGAEIAQRLEALDRRFPKAERSMRMVVLLNAQQLLRDSTKFEYLMTDYPLRAGPGSLFSVRLLKANAFERWDYYLDRLRGCDTRPWEEIQQVGRDISNELQGIDPHVLQLPLLHLAHELGPARESLAQLRLLRTALAFRRTGSAAPLADPFGGMIDTQVSGPSLAAWSKGMGSGDRSKGSWKRAGDVMEALNRGALRIDLTR